MNVSKKLRELRGDMTLREWEKKAGILPGTQVAWEKGKSEPREGSINELAFALGLSDNERMALMPEPKTKGLGAKFTRHMQYLALNTKDVALVLYTSETTVKRWRAGNISQATRPLVKDFLRMDAEEAYALMRYRKKEIGEPKERIEIDYKLLHKLETKYERKGGLRNAEDDDPELKKLQAKMNGAEQ